jgi:hypothetical protein
MSKHQVHSTHSHAHSANCGHSRVQHEDHTDYIHDGHLHFEHDGHYDEHSLAVSSANPAVCKKVSCSCDHNGCGHPRVPHGDHVDYLSQGTLHFRHDGHCDDHGRLPIA